MEKTVLVVEACSSNRKVLAALLEREGVRVLGEADPQRALLILSDKTPDLVISSLEFSGKMDGVSFCEQARSLAGDNFPLILNPASLSNEQRQRAARCVNSIIQKPDVKGLLDETAKILGFG